MENKNCWSEVFVYLTNLNKYYCVLCKGQVTYKQRKCCKCGAKLDWQRLKDKIGLM